MEVRNYSLQKKTVHSCLQVLELTCTCLMYLNIMKLFVMLPHFVFKINFEPEDDQPRAKKCCYVKQNRMYVVVFRLLSNFAYWKPKYTNQCTVCIVCVHCYLHYCVADVQYCCNVILPCNAWIARRTRHNRTLHPSVTTSLSAASQLWLILMF